MDRLSNTKSNVSATYGRRLNKSYYEPFQGFAYCILMINIVDMKKKKEIKIAGSLTLALTGSGYLSKLQHFITSTAGFELTLRPHSPLMVWACPLVELIATNPPQQFTKSHKKHWTVSRGVQKKTPNKNLWWCFFQEASSCAQFRRGWKIKMRTSENPLTVLT